MATGCRAADGKLCGDDAGHATTGNQGRPRMTDAYSDAVAAYGRGNFAAALEMFRTAAEGGDASAQYNLGFLYDTGRGVAQDDAAALRWYEAAALQGYAGAQHALGVMYGSGRGVTQDYAEAHRWFYLAALQNNSGAQYNLGLLYDAG